MNRAKSTIDIFTSHAWAYGHRRDDLHRILNPWVRGADYRERSVSSRHPVDTKNDAELESVLRWLIAGSDVLIVMAGMYLIDRRWMEFEIETAYQCGVPVVPVLDNGQQRVPEFARLYAACDDVKWRGDSIRDAILNVISAEQRRAFLWRRESVRLAAEARDRERQMFDYLERLFQPPTSSLTRTPPTTPFSSVDLLEDPPLSPFSMVPGTRLRRL